MLSCDDKTDFNQYQSINNEGWKANENVMIAYSYDVPLSALSTVNTGSHEIMINYNLNKVIGNPLPARIIYNPRFLY